MMDAVRASGRDPPCRRPPPPPRPRCSSSFVGSPPYPPATICGSCLPATKGGPARDGLPFSSSSTPPIGPSLLVVDWWVLWSSCPQNPNAPTHCWRVLWLSHPSEPNENCENEAASRCCRRSPPRRGAKSSSASFLLEARRLTSAFVLLPPPRPGLRPSWPLNLVGLSGQSRLARSALQGGSV